LLGRRRGRWLEVELVLDSEQARGDDRGAGEIRVRHRRRRAVLDMLRGDGPALDADEGRAVLEPPGDVRRAERMRAPALHAVHGRGEERVDRASVRELAGDEAAGERRDPVLVALVAEEVLAALRVEERDVRVAAGAGA